MRLFDVSAVAIRKAKPASVLVTWAVTWSVLVVRCNLVASILCERGGGTQGLLLDRLDQDLIIGFLLGQAGSA